VEVFISDVIGRSYYNITGYLPGGMYFSLKRIAGKCLEARHHPAARAGSTADVNALRQPPCPPEAGVI
jgi:hypothetical protein